MLQVVHKIIAFIIALAIVLSTMSFTVEKHVCRGEVTDVAYFEEAEGCGMEEVVCDEDISTEQVRQTPCCDTVNDLIEGNENEQQAQKSFELKDAKMILAFVLSYLDLLEPVVEPVVAQNNSPPLVKTNIQALYQTYLI